jgi:predicted dehydrogenase
MHRILVVGGGSIGERHARCFLKTGRAEVALCDNRPERLRQLAAAYPLTGAHADFNQVDLSKFHAAVICVPADLHVPWARKVVESGAHVLIEKPLSLSLDGIDDLDRLAKKKGRVAGVAHVLRAMPAMQAVKRELDSGKIGDVLAFSCVVGYDHRTARPDYRNTYWAHREQGGGVIFDSSSHLTNMLQWYLGPVRSVMAEYEHLQIEGTEAEDTLSYLPRFRNSPAIGAVHMVAWQAQRADQLILSGTKGSIHCDGWEGRLGVMLRGGPWTWTEIPKEQPDSKGQTDGPFVYQANNFLDAMEGKGELLCSLPEARHTIEVCLAISESGRRRAEVVIEERESLLGA